MRKALIFLLWLCPLCVSADEWDDFVEYMTTEEGAESDALAEQLDLLEQIHLAPLNVNACTRVDMEQISFLSPEQVEDILFYVGLVKGMKTLEELVYVKSLDYNTRRWLALFLYAGEYPQRAARKARFSDGRHEVLTRVDVPLYLRAGYSAENEARRYQGSRIAHTLKYTYKLRNLVSVGLVVGKDQGEPVGKPFTLGYDYVGGHAMVKNIGCLKALVAGDYRVGFGEGLLLNQNYSIGKSVQNLNHSNGISAKTSTAETNYMRGTAAAVEIVRRLTLTAFVSYNMLDATLDGTGRAASGLSEVGTHRNEREMAKLHNTSETVYGGHVGWRDSTYHVGVSGYGSVWHLPFVRGSEAYREFYPEGDRFWGVSADYGVRLGKWSIMGETATNGKGVATLERVVFRLNSRFQAQVAGRYYSPEYHSFYSRALSEWDVQNETGVYVSVDAQPLRQWQFTFSGDVFHSPHSRYGIDHATTGQELRLTTTYTLNRKNFLRARVSWKRKEQYNVMHSQQRYELRWTLKLKTLELRTQGQLAHYSDASGRRSLGYDIQETARWQDRRDRVRLAMSAAWFQTDDYYGRVYVTEPTVIGGMSSTMLYGRGVRLAMTARANLPWRLMVMARYSFSRYFDRETIGSDLQEIPMPWQNDLSVQLRWTF